MREKPTYLTLEGRDGLTEELNHLRDVRRVEVSENIRIAKEYTDTLDNAEFDQARNEQAFVEGRILTLESLLSHAVMIDPEHVRHDVVSLGVKVEAVDEDGQRSVYAIVGSAEANPVQGKISNESPLGQALLGKQAGDVVEFTAPAGVFHYTIVNIE
jgi:transcription elongation factor GreA